MRTIVIVDNEILLAEALAEIISNFTNYNVLYVVENGKAMIEKFSEPQNVPDIVLLDVGMPVMDGFETAAWLRTHFPKILVLALSVNDDENIILRMVKSGAKGYLLKNISKVELRTALDSLFEKGYYYSEWITHSLLQNISKNDDLTPNISDREIHFLQLASSDKELTYKEIAELMFCSTRTVEGYRDSLFEKFGVKTRLGLVLSALKNGILTLE